MGKKCSFNKHIKKMIAFVLVCLIAITLTGCDSSNRRGEGSLNFNDTYASLGDNYSITVGELYDSLRYNANDYLENTIMEFVYAKEIEELKADLVSESPKYAEKLNEVILTEVYGTSDADEIEELTDKDVKVNTYVDNMLLEGYKISAQDVKDGNFSSVQPKYYLEVAKHIAAKAHLTEEFTVENGVINFGEINDESYFTTDEVIQWYKDNYTNKGDVTAVLVRFMSSTEANAVLKAFGIKTYDGAWYQIPLDVNETKTKTDYDNYYDEYVIDPTDPEKDNSSIEVLGNGKVTILKIFIEIYNYIYGGFRNLITDEYKAEGTDPVLTTSYEAFVNTSNHPSHLNYYYYIQSLIASEKVGTDYTDEDYVNDYNALKTLLVNYDAELKAENEDLETIVMSSDRLNGYNASLATYVYNTLATEVAEGAQTYTQYSTSAKAYGDYYYLVFKLDQIEDEELYVENENENSDETEVEFTNTELLNTILNEMFEAEITETYIHEVEHERLEDIELKIYDSIVELMFTQSKSELAEHYHKTKKSNNDDIALVKYQGEEKHIKVDELYEYLEPLYGPQQAMALLFNKYIKDTPYYDEVEGNYDDYVLMLENMLSYFANDYYASYGYPSSIGKYNFMLLYYRTADVDVAIKDYLMVSDAQSAFYQDVLAKFDSENSDEFFQNLLTYGNASYDKYFSLTATGLNVYVDKDEDGVHDELAENDPLRTQAQALMTEAIKYIETSVEDYATAINNLITEYKSTSRVEENNPTEAGSRWWEYRKAGLYLESTSVGEVTNASNDSEIKDRINLLYTQLKADKILTDKGFASSVLDTLDLDNDAATKDHLIATENGYTVLLITAGANPTSAKYDDEESLDSYLEIPVIINDEKTTITLEYTENKVTLNQTKVYVSEYLLLGDVYSLPETTTTALDTYILPLLERYTSAASQYNQIMNEMGTITFATNADERAAFLAEYINIQERVADSYDTDLYPDWWTNMYE